MKLLYIGAAGTDDPTRATFPFLVATGITLMGEAAPLIKNSIAAITF